MANTVRKITSDTADLAGQESDADDLAALLKGAADPLRLQILRVLNTNAFGAMELSEIFAMRQNAMSHHLKLLSRAGFINSRREGTHIFYRRSCTQSRFRRLYDEIFSAVNEIVLPDDMQQRLDTIQQARASTSKVFFKRNAEKFREQQDLIASFPQYGEAVLSTLDNYPLSGNSVLEVGPGQGDLLKGLSRRFQQVYALDNSEEMLEQAKRTAQNEQLTAIKFILGDTSSELLGERKFDAITLNMVLHHTPVPSEIIGDLSSRLAEHGLLLVTELCEHDQDWVRDACGDLWLGFNPEELTAWATHAGLEDIGSEYLALKNGFSIQIRQFRRPLKSAVDKTTGALPQ